MKNLIVVFLLLIVGLSMAQTKTPEKGYPSLVKGKCFQGYIFDKYAEVFPNEDTNFKFTPTYENVAEAEQIVYDSLILTGKLSM